MHGPKWILRDLLASELPRDLFERPKRGFGAPIPRWLADPLRNWAEDLLAFGARGALDPWVSTGHVEATAEAWRSGRDPGWHLWTLLQLLAWWRGWKNHDE